MKKLFIIAAIVLAAVTIIVVSCKKEDKKSDKTELVKSNKIIVNDDELSEMDEAMIAFGERLKASSMERGEGETMPIVEGLNTLTNYQNFSLCDACIHPTEMV